MLISDLRPARDDLRAAASTRSGRLPLLIALGFLLAGTGYRLVTSLVGTPRTDSDEAIMGLAALHVSTGRHWPVYFYGQHYMGTLEAYLAAPIFAVAGPSVFALRLPNLLLYVLFVVLMWRLTVRLYPSRWFPVLIVALLALGADRVLRNQLIAGGGYPEMNPAGALLMLLALGLATGAYRRPTPALAVGGLVTGLMLWVDPLLLPYLAAAGAVVLWFTWRRLRGRAVAVLVGSVLLGAAPAIWYAVANRRNPLSALFNVSSGGEPAGWLDRLSGGVLLGVPMGTGFCGPGWCAGWQLWWAPVLLILLGVATVAAVRALRTGEPRDRAIVATRLALLVAAGLTLLGYASSNTAGSTPVQSARYLSTLVISLPVLLWPLWAVAREHTRVFWRPVAVLVLAGVVASMTVATAQAVGTVPANRGYAANHQALIDELRRLGIRHVYSHYWSCNTITFATEEEIVCAVVEEDDLSPGHDRYPAYRVAVDAAPDPVYVLPAGSRAEPLVRQALRERYPAGGEPVLRTVPGYTIHMGPE